MPIDTDEGQIICNLIAVHAGLEKSIDLNEQLIVLRTRDTRVPKVPMLSGRHDVWNTPKVSYYVYCPLFHLTKTWLLMDFNIIFEMNINLLGDATYSAECFVVYQVSCISVKRPAWSFECIYKCFKIYTMHFISFALVLHSRFSCTI